MVDRTVVVDSIHIEVDTGPVADDDSNQTAATDTQTDEERCHRSFHQTEQEVVLRTCFHHREVVAEDHRNFHNEELQIDW